MSVIKTIVAILAITMALTLILTVKQYPARGRASDQQPSEPAARKMRVSRFLQQKEKNPRAADHCNKDNEVCSHTLEGGRNATCCNNKCMDLWYDDNNCGACKNKCDFTDTCCRGECVNLVYDKRHCGFCGNKCMPGGLCIYGICDYA